MGEFLGRRKIKNKRKEKKKKRKKEKLNIFLVDTLEKTVKIAVIVLHFSITFFTFSCMHGKKKYYFKV